MSLLDAPEEPPDVTSTPAMRLAIVSCLPVFVCGLGELSISLVSLAPAWLLTTTYLCAMLSWPSILPIVAATLWASQQGHLAGASKLVMWATVAVALLLTLILPARVINKKYFVHNRDRVGFVVHARVIPESKDVNVWGA